MTVEGHYGGKDGKKGKRRQKQQSTALVDFSWSNQKVKMRGSEIAMEDRERAPQKRQRLIVNRAAKDL
jgi:hypothetical protein